MILILMLGDKMIMFNKHKKGEYGYIDSYKKSKLIISLIFAAMISFIIITMLFMFGSTQRIMVIFAILLVLPFSKFLIGYIMCAAFKPLSHESYDRISKETKEASGNLLYDVVITRTEGMKFYQSMYICNSRIYAYVEDKKFNDNKKAYETWIKECVNGTKFDYNIKVFSDLEEYIKKVNSVSAANDKTVKIDKHMVERILVTCV